MPDEDDDDLVDPNEPPNVRQMRQQIKAQRAQLKTLEEAQARAERFERELAIRDAGIDLSPTQRKALFAVHEGDFTPDAIKGTAVELGFVSAEPPASELTAEDVARLRRIDQATAGAASGGTPVDQTAQENAKLASFTNEAEFDAYYRSLHRPMR